MFTKKIGFVAVPGCNVPDLIGTQAMLNAALSTRSIFVGHSAEAIAGRSGLTVVADVSFDSCPKLDVLVVGDLDESSLEDDELRHFLKRATSTASHVIGIGSGVLALAKAGVLVGRKATSDAMNTDKLTYYGVTAVEADTVVHDGRFFTAGPSTGAIEAGFSVLREISGDFFAKLSELTLEYDPKLQFPKHWDGEPTPPDDRGLVVAVLVAPGMYAPDVAGAIETLGALPGVTFHYVWKSKEPVKSLLGPTIIPNTLFDECPQADVLIMGAHLPQRTSDPDVLTFLQRQHAGAKAIISVCAGSLLIGAAGLLKGETATSNFHMTGLLRHCEVVPSHNEVVSSGKFYTTGPAIGSFEAALMAIRDIYGESVAAYVERKILEYSPNPVFGVGSPTLAGRFLTAVSRAAVAPALPFYRWSLKRGFRSKIALPPNTMESVPAK